MITTEQAVEMINKKNQDNDQSKSAENVNENTGIVNQEGHDKMEAPQENLTPVSTENSNGGQKNDEIKGDEAGTDEPVEKSEENSNSTVKDKGKKSQKEKRDYAFIRQKEKIKKLQEEVAQLKEFNKRYEGLKPEHFKDDEGNIQTDKYINWKLKDEQAKTEIARREQQIDEIRQAQANAENERRAKLCFNEDEYEEYRNLLETNGDQFYAALNKADPNHIIEGYLNTVEKYPIVLKRLMTNMDELREVFKFRNNPYLLAQSIDKYTQKVLSENSEAKKPALPITGRQTTSNPAKTEPQVRDRNYWNKYLIEHRKG